MLLDPMFSVKAAKLTAASVPENSTARDPYWDNKSFALVHAATMAEAIKGDEPYLSHVAEKLYGNVFEYAAETVAQVKMREVRLIMEGYSAAKADDIKSLKEVIENTRSHLRYLLDENIAECLSKDDGFSFSQMNEETVTLYVILPLSVVGVLGRFFKLIVASALTEVFDQEDL